MKTCPTCGKMSEDYVSVCDQCGTTLLQKTAVDRPSGGLNFLSFICPPVGLILFIQMKYSNPIRGRSCGKWAIIGTITFVVLFAALCSLLMILPIVLSMYL